MKRGVSLSVQRRPDHLEEVVLPVQLAVDAHGEGALADGVQGQPLEQVVDVDQRGPGAGRGVAQQPHHGADRAPHDARHLPHLGRGEGGGQHSPATLTPIIVQDQGRAGAAAGLSSVPGEWRPCQIVRRF